MTDGPGEEMEPIPEPCCRNVTHVCVSLRVSSVWLSVLGLVKEEAARTALSQRVATRHV